MGSTCRPMAVSFQCMTKFTTNKKNKIKIKIKKKKVPQSCLTLCNPMDYTVHGILQVAV